MRATSSVYFQKLAVLNYYVERLDRQETDCAYYDFFPSKIIPLLRIINPSLASKWHNEISNFASYSEQLKLNALVEIKNILSLIKEVLVKEGIYETFRNQVVLIESIIEWEGLSNRSIKELLEQGEMEKLNSEPTYVMQALYEQAMDPLKQLLQEIVQSGRHDLVKDYIEFICTLEEYIESEEAPQKYQCLGCFHLLSKQLLRSLYPDAIEDVFYCPKCGMLLQQFREHIIKKNFYIRVFNQKTFVPSFFKLLELKDLFWKSAAGAWQTLCNIEWARSDQRDYFRQILHYINPEECQRSERLLNENLMRLEVLAVKNKKQGRHKVTLFKRDFIEKKLQMVLREFDIQSLPSSLKEVRPHAIELYLVDDVNFILTVYWAEDIIEFFQLHTFQDCDDVRCKFIKGMLDSPGEEVTFSRIKNGAKAIKYLQQCGIYGVLRELFIKKTTTYSAVLKAKKVYLDNQPQTLIVKLCEHLENIKDSTWTKNYSAMSAYL